MNQKVFHIFKKIFLNLFILKDTKLRPLILPPKDKNNIQKIINQQVYNLFFVFKIKEIDCCF